MDKLCSKCGVAKPVEEFHCDSTTLDGRKTACKPCRGLMRRVHNRTFVPPQPATKTLYSVNDLPNPELLPATYLKRCADLWLSLTEGEERTRLI